MNAAADAVERALADERLRNAHLINVNRLAGVAIFLAVVLVSQATLQRSKDRINPSFALFAAWAVGAALVLWGSRRSERIGRLGGLSIPLIDMPMLFLLFANTILRLRASGFASDAAALAAHAAGPFVLLVFLASLSLERRQVYFAAAVAAALEVWLGHLGVMDLTVRATSAVVMLSAAVLFSTASRRAVDLVASVAGEQIRRERLGRYFSPQIAARLAERSESAAAGESREVTILFSDIRDFTALSAELTSEESSAC